LNNILSVVIPAYKPQFFEEALESIANQSCKKFNCYIFDDCGPKEISDISEKFPQFKYHRFSENLGGRNLIEHWNRCLKKISEEWVWFFSDDDVACKNCVEEFYKKQKEYPNNSLFRFELDRVDETGNDNWSSNGLSNQTSLEFLESRLKGYIRSAVPNYIFNKKRLFELNKGFVNFPLAWNSDDATWMLLGKENGIAAINSARVKWRISGQNITSKRDNFQEKSKADILFYKWCADNFSLSIRLKWLFAKWFSRRRLYKKITVSPVIICSIFMKIYNKANRRLKRC